MKKEIKSTEVPKAIGPYSQGIEAQNIVFTSGQIYLTKEGIRYKRGKVNTKICG